MKIIKALVAAVVLVAFAIALSGCAHVSARSGSSGPELAGQASGIENGTGMEDYRQVISAPGPF
jgi:uncharacterized protein YceK